MEKQLNAFVRYLKKHLPAPNGKPIYVKCRPRKTVFATVVSDETSHRVTISTTQEHISAIDSLCHEWAHILDFNGVDENNREEHRQSWGKQYAKVYQHYRRFRAEWDKRC